MMSIVFAKTSPAIDPHRQLKAVYVAADVRYLQQGAEDADIAVRRAEVAFVVPLVHQRLLAAFRCRQSFARLDDGSEQLNHCRQPLQPRS